MSGLMFKPELVVKIADGEKTQTRRPMSPNPRSPWFEGGCQLQPGMTRAVVPGRGKHGVGHVKIEPIGDWDAARLSELRQLVAGQDGG